MIQLETLVVFLEDLKADFLIFPVKISDFLLLSKSAKFWPVMHLLRFLNAMQIVKFKSGDFKEKFGKLFLTLL